MSSAPLYRIRGVSKSRENGFSLRIPSLEIAAGETLCLLGPTGAGKTTLLRLLAGVESVDEGEARLDGETISVDRFPLDVRRRIAVVHQRPLMLSSTVAENVGYGLRVRGACDRAGAVREMLARLGSERLAGCDARSLSGGEAQLVALGRALIVRPEILLLDEPTANLDPARVALVERLIGEARRGSTRAVVWATHNLFQARRTADRVALLLDGELVEVAPTETFFESPADPRAGDFVRGVMVY